jgi:hypothetical protein
MERELFEFKKGIHFEGFNSMIENDSFGYLGLRGRRLGIVSGIGYFVLAFCLFYGS